MAERVPVGRAKLGGEIDVAAELEHAVVIAVEDRLGLLGGERILLEVPGLVRLEGCAVLGLHQRHAEHVDAVALTRALGIEDERARDVLVFVFLVLFLRLRPSHRRVSLKACGRDRAAGNWASDTRRKTAWQTGQRFPRGGYQPQ